MHDRIDELSNDVLSSNWFEDHLLFEMLSNRFEDRESCCRFELKISNSLRFEFEIFLFDSNE